MSVHDERVAEFHRLHSSGCFVMPNPWDVGSARFLAHAGFRALASTSAGFAFARGLADGPDAVPLDAARDYAAEDADITLRLHRLLKPRVVRERMATVYETIERPLMPVVASMERHGIKVERSPDIMNMDFQSFRSDKALDLHRSVGLPLVGVAHDVIDSLVASENDGVAGRLIHACQFADGVNEGASQSKQPKVAGNGERPGRSIRGHAALPESIVRQRFFHNAPGL